MISDVIICIIVIKISSFMTKYAHMKIVVSRCHVSLLVGDQGKTALAAPVWL